MLVLGLINVWPSHPRLLLKMSISIRTWFVLSQRSLLPTLSIHSIPNILCKRQFTNPSLAQTYIYMDRVVTFTNLYHPRNRITDSRIGWNTASRPVAAVILLELGTRVSYWTDTSAIVHQSYNATCPVILIHKSDVGAKEPVDRASNYPARSMDSCAN